MRVSAEDVVDDVMRQDPSTICVFLGFKFGCVGYPGVSKPRRSRKVPQPQSAGSLSSVK